MTDSANAIEQLSMSYIQRYPEEVAQWLEKKSADDVLHFFNTQEIQKVVPLVNRLAPATAAQVLAGLDARLFRQVVPQMDLNRAVILISQWDEEEQHAHLEMLDRETAQDIRALLSYSADSAGYYMDPRVLRFRSETTVEEALRILQRNRSRRILDLFIVDGDGTLKGSIPLQNILWAEENDQLGSLIEREPVTIQAVSSRDEAIDIFQRGRLSTLPVVDYENRLLGVIRQQAMMQAAEVEASTNIQTMVGVSKDERTLSKTSFAIKKRLPWLHINLVTAFIAAGVVGLFEGTIARFTALAVLMPVVAGQSGNTGAQALAVTMRGLVLREVRVRQWPRVLWKEARVGLLNGVAVAVTTAFGVWLWSRNSGLAAVIAMAMVISMVVASLAGAIIPILLEAFGQDPATSSSIILTTVTDVVGFLSFLGLATIFARFLA